MLDMSINSTSAKKQFMKQISRMDNISANISDWKSFTTINVTFSQSDKHKLLFYSDIQCLQSNFAALISKKYLSF